MALDIRSAVARSNAAGMSRGFEVAPVKPDPMMGRHVEIRSAAGIVYRGVVKAIRDGGELGELFELGSPSDADYQRLVHVSDRFAQIAEVAAAD